MAEAQSPKAKGSLLDFPCLITSICRSLNIPGIQGSEKPKGALKSASARVILGRHPTPIRGADDTAEQPAPPGSSDFQHYFEQMQAQFQEWAGTQYARIEDQYYRIEDHYRPQEERDRRAEAREQRELERLERQEALWKAQQDFWEQHFGGGPSGSA